MIGSANFLETTDQFASAGPVCLIFQTARSTNLEIAWCIQVWQASSKRLEQQNERDRQKQTNRTERRTIFDIFSWIRILDQVKLKISLKSFNRMELFIVSNLRKMLSFEFAIAFYTVPSCNKSIKKDLFVLRFETATRIAQPFIMNDLYKELDNSVNYNYSSMIEVQSLIIFSGSTFFVWLLLLEIRTTFWVDMSESSNLV